MNTSSMTIGKRLAIGFGGVFLLIMLLSAMAISRVSNIETSLNQINQVNNVKQRYAINFRGSVHDRAIALRDVVLASDPAAATPHIELIKKLADNYARSAAPLDDLFAARGDTSAEEKSALAAIKDSERKNQPLIAAVIALRMAVPEPAASPAPPAAAAEAAPVAAGATAAPAAPAPEAVVPPAPTTSEAAALLASQAAPAFVEWLASVNRLIDLEEKLNAAEAAKASALASTFLVWMAVLCAIAVAVGSLAAWYISRGLLRQLGGQPDYAAAIVRSIAAGNLAVQIDTRADDSAS
ncbi:MAG: MCP four helix bundle domain-containing protein, partial [Telluria sp.]